MRRFASAIMAVGFALTIKAQGPIGPVGGARGLQSFTFQNSNGFIGNVSIVSGSVTLSLQLGNQAIGFNQISNIASGNIIGRKTPGTGAIEVLATSDALDFIGNTRGAILYRGASGWSILAPSNNTDILVSQGAGADPHFITDVNEKSANKNQANGYIGADAGGLVPNNKLQTTVELTTHKNSANGYLGLGASSTASYNNIGTGGDGSGNHFYADDGAFHTLAGGGSVSNFSSGNLSPLFTASVANATTTPALSFTLSNAAGYSWFGNAAAGSGAPSYNTSVLPAALMPALTGDVTNTAGTLATTISPSTVTYSKIQNISASRLLGNPTGSPAAPLEISIDGGLSFSSSTLRAFNTSSSLAAYAIDSSTTKSFYKTLIAGANTFTWSNFKDGDSITVSCKQVASGTVGTVVFPSAGGDGAHTTYWQGGSQPVQTTTFGKRDRYQFHCYNGGDVDALVIQNF